MSLRSIPPGFIYYWLKDIIVNEFLKMSVLSAALEISERVGVLSAEVVISERVGVLSAEVVSAVFRAVAVIWFWMWTFLTGTRYEGI